MIVKITPVVIGVLPLFVSLRDLFDECIAWVIRTDELIHLAKQTIIIF